MKAKPIDFNGILAFANLLILFLLIWAFAATGGNEYVDRQTMLLGVALSIQTQIALRLERRRRDPFTVLLALSMTFYYLLRLVTLLVYPYSLVFDRFPYYAGDSSYALIFIIIANFFLYAGFYVVRFRNNRVVKAGAWRGAHPARVVLLMIAAIVFAYFRGVFWTEDTVPRVFNFLVIFLSQNTVLMIALAYYFFFRKSLTRTSGLMIATLIVVEMAAHTLIGGKGALVAIIQNYLLAALAVSGYVTFSRRTVIFAVAGTPLLAVFLAGAFAISTYNRANKDTGAYLDVGQAVSLAGESASDLSNNPAFDILVPAIAARAGFFDFSAELIAHRTEYAPAINPGAYWRSIVDNVLTPGFDVYDQPKISNALQFVYLGLGSPSKEMVMTSYQSDQMGIYGEFYVLFGYFALPLMFLIAYAFKRVYVRLTGARPFSLVIKRVVVLFVFIRMVDSFGIDWTILETLPLVAAVFIYQPFFGSKRGVALAARTDGICAAS